MPRSSSLVLWMNGVRVGVWTQTRGSHLLRLIEAVGEIDSVGHGFLQSSS